MFCLWLQQIAVILLYELMYFNFFKKLILSQCSACEVQQTDREAVGCELSQWPPVFYWALSQQQNQGPGSQWHFVTGTVIH